MFRKCFSSNVKYLRAELAKEIDVKNVKSDINMKREIFRCVVQIMSSLKGFCSASHSLYNLVPPYRTSDLRQRGHPFQLPVHYTDFA